MFKKLIEKIKNATKSRELKKDKKKGQKEQNTEDVEKSVPGKKPENRVYMIVK